MESKCPGPRNPSPPHSAAPPAFPFFARCLLLPVAASLLSSCATPALDAGRYNYYAGRLDKAVESLTSGKTYPKDRALLLMERGMARQAAGDYEGSAADWIEAYNELERLETYSLSKGSASLVVNDGVQPFRGAPYERTLLHVLTAISHLARADWDNAAVEARRIIRSLSPERKGDYPEDAFSRYMAGFALEMIDDPSNAALQYRLANALLRDVEINEVTGYLRPREVSATNILDSANPPASRAALKGPAAPPPWPPARYENELVCFLLLGRSPGRYMRWSENWQPGPPLYAEIHHGGQCLGRSYNLTDTADLAFRTAEKEAALKAAKTITRVAIKEGVAQAVERETNDALGALVRIMLIGILEQPDTRRWETLPRWLQVARVPCPPDLSAYDVVVKTAEGRTVRTFHVEQPITRRRNVFVTFCRDLPAQRPALVRTTPAPAASASLP